MNAEERAKGIDPLEVLQLCKDFLGNKWSAVNEENFNFTVLAQGFGNRLFVVGVKDGVADTVEPKQVLVRYYGGNFLPQDMPNRTMTEAGEVLTFYCLGKSGIGPQLYGVFKGGRIEEFIPSTNFTMDRFCEDEQNRAMFYRVAERAGAPKEKGSGGPTSFLRFFQQRKAEFLESYPQYA
ncbi:Choline kinase alpha [Halotydeus destructor]|nr:Choline kinase alpha [Halotydeus destructor]